MTAIDGGYDDYPPDDLKDTVERAVSTLRPHAGEFDSVAVRGVSGMIVGAPVAIALGKPLIVVRKDTETSHGSALSNYRHAGGSYLFLDDFISLGHTRRIVMEAMRDKTAARYAGEYMYHRDRYVRAGEER